MKLLKNFNKASLELIDELDLTLGQVAQIKGSGKDGVILKRDVEAFLSDEFVQRLIPQETGTRLIQFGDIPNLRFSINGTLCGLRQTMGPAGRYDIYPVRPLAVEPVKEVDEGPVPAEHGDAVIVEENFEVN